MSTESPDEFGETVDELFAGRGHGTRNKLVIEYSRDLTAADLAALSLPRNTVQPSLKRIHSSHHALAKCIASGMRYEQASLVTGYSYGRISILMSDPTFKALVNDYQQESREIFADMAERMKGISLDALETLHERLHEKPDDFSVGMLLDVVKAFADRTGYGPNQEVHLKMSTDTIDRPPRETKDEWEKRRLKELSGPDVEASVGTPAWPANRGNNGRLVS